MRSDSEVAFARCLERLGASPRETDIALLVVRHHTNAEMSRELAISESTVKTHLRRLYRKPAIGSRRELVELVMDDLVVRSGRRPSGPSSQQDN